MAITGAIFDCDGTLVDSMPMWFDVFYKLLENHGYSRKDPAVISAVVEAEPLSIPEEITFLKDRLGLSGSERDLFDELDAMVRFAYANTIESYPRVKPFLEGLHQMGVPMIVASSTGASDVRIALRAHGLEQYFIDIVSAEELGLSKEEPTIYYQALEKLGTSKESTWVFEDAPFGVLTAHNAGFPVVCVFNGHDNRDEKLLRDNSDIFTFEFEGLDPHDLASWSR
ncbi:MAG: HAD family hydrolase [Tractidigestivibacter sp.]|jgi:HAD superfamily hydrolase (TIGR01509 family)|uniref:HAD family hydrolase n=1 Tax=Tractidigestivibacter sp. TaxID=2847320 RepID=UPI003D8DFBA8